MKKELFDITGMTCSACAARVERVVLKLDGIHEVSVNLLKNNMTVSFDENVLSSDQIIKKVSGIGFGAALHKQTFEKEKTANDNQPDSAAAEMHSMKKRLIVSLIFAVPLFFIAMGEMMGLQLPGFLIGTDNAMIFAFTQFLLVIPIIIAGNRYFRVGSKNLVKLSPNMDSLITLGAGAAFIYGIYAIYNIAWGFGHDDMDLVQRFSMELYFECVGVMSV